MQRAGKLRRNITKRWIRVLDIVENKIPTSTIHKYSYKDEYKLIYDKANKQC